MPLPSAARVRSAARPPFAAVLAIALSLVSGCTGDPWVDSRREAGETTTVGRSTLDHPAICYASGATTSDQLYRMAQEVCDRTGRVAVYQGVEKWQCRLTTPHRAIFLCR